MKCICVSISDLDILKKINAKDAQHVMHYGYESFFKSYNWPFRKSGKKIQVFDNGWNDICPEMLESFLNLVFKKIEMLFNKFVVMNNWLNRDSQGKYPKYSLHVYGKKPIAKIKTILYKKNNME
jgi:hypothetical protein